MREAYIVNGFRTAVGKAPRGSLRFLRPDLMGAKVIEHLLLELPDFDTQAIDDLIVGCAMPEGEQGLNVGRLISLMSFDHVKVPGFTVNRYCASGSESIAIGVSKIQSGMSDCVIAGGIESMSYIPMGGYRIAPSFEVTKDGRDDCYYGMGLTAEAVAKQFQVSREDQDQFAFESHQKAINALKNNHFEGQIVPLEVEQNYFENEKVKQKTYTFDTDEGPRFDTSLEALARLRPVFAAGGSVTAGNSSQTSDGAAFLLIVSEEILKRYNLKPMAKLVSYATAGVEPKIMGIGPVDAVPKALEKANMTLDKIELIELNEAFASQSLAVIRNLGLDSKIVNVNGGAIALGHPLGCTGAKLTVQLLNEMKRTGKKHGMVTMCVGAGQGAASIFELL